MKLIVCDKCSDVFKLSHEMRTCKCGHCKGRYVNDIEAETNGNGFALAIDNESLVNAIQNLQAIPSNNHIDNYIDDCRIEYAWVRPHEGLGNPNTKVNKDL